MKILDAGHKYILNEIGSNINHVQVLTFIKREGKKYPFNNGSFSGTNCQEVLRVLIDRCEYLQRQKPCAETEAIIGNLKSALLLFELRAAKEHERIEDFTSIQELMYRVSCETCGHIGCVNTEHRNVT